MSWPLASNTDDTIEVWVMVPGATQTLTAGKQPAPLEAP
jgi:hypothetical protein